MLPLEFVNGLFSLLIVSISTVIGVIIASRYLKYSNPTLLMLGIFWIGLFSPWWPSTVSFLILLFIDTPTPLTTETYVLIGNLLGPLIITLWMYVFTNLKYKEKQKIILGVYIIIGVIAEILLLYYVSVNVGTVAVFENLDDRLDIKYMGSVLYYALFIVITLLITGFLFGRDSMKSIEPEMKLKGKFLTLAFLSWCIGAIIDAAIDTTFLTLTIARLILISSAFEFYIGFIMPEFIKKRFIK